jgi:hypothetical protein
MSERASTHCLGGAVALAHSGKAARPCDTHRYGKYLCSIRLTGGRRGVAERTADEFDQEQTRLLDALDGLAPADALDRLTALAARAGARRLLETLDREGGIRPCGQGCGWEGAWSADSTLWPADRERSLGERSVPLSPAEQAEQEEQARLRPR